jgi:hypothetical protein
LCRINAYARRSDPLSLTLWGLYDPDSPQNFRNDREIHAKTLTGLEGHADRIGAIDVTGSAVQIRGLLNLLLTASFANARQLRLSKERSRNGQLEHVFLNLSKPIHETMPNLRPLELAHLAIFDWSNLIGAFFGLSELVIAGIVSYREEPSAVF